MEIKIIDSKPDEGFGHIQIMTGIEHIDYHNDTETLIYDDRDGDRHQVPLGVDWEVIANGQTVLTLATARQHMKDLRRNTLAKYINEG